MVLRGFCPVALASLFSVLPLISQPITRPLNILVPLGYNRVGSEFWASGGAGIAEYGSRGSSLANPATISFPSLTITAETGWRLKTTYLTDVQFDNIAVSPAYASLGVPIGPISVEAGYSRTIDTKVVLPDITITTESDPSGTGETFDAVSTTSIKTGFAGFSCAVADQFSIGASVGLDFVRFEYSFAENWVKATGKRLQLNCGVVARPIENLSVGLSVHWSQDVTLNYETNVVIITLTPNPPRPIGIVALPDYVARSPLRIALGSAADLLPQVKILASAEYQHWSAIDEGSEDIWQYHFGAVSTPIPGLTLRAGYFTQRHPNDYLRDYFAQQFLTMGFTLNIIDGVATSVTYLTSKPFTKSPVKSSYFVYNESLQQKMVSASVSIAL
jgi:hypothetical protein